MGFNISSHLEDIGENISARFKWLQIVSDYMSFWKGWRTFRFHKSREFFD